MTLILRLDGFRSHNSKKVEFPLSGATYVCGPNGSGKTDIYRAIRWVLFPKKNDVIHPIGTSTTVRVSLRMNGIRIVRTAVTNSLLLQHQGKTYHNEDAEARILSLFGSENAWHLSSYVVAGIHPYIIANSQKRAEMLNEFLEETRAKENLTNIITAIKKELKALGSVHEKEMIRYEAVYGTQVVDASKILNNTDRSEASRELISLRKLVTEYQVQLNKRAILEDKIATVNATISKLSPHYSAEGLEELRNACSLSLKYNSAKSSLEVLMKSVGVRGVRVTQDDLTNCVVAERDYRSSLDAFKKAGLRHTEDAPLREIENYELSLQYGEILLNNEKYRRVETSLAQISNTSSCTTSEESAQLERDLTNKIASLTKSIQYAPAFEQQAQFETLLKELQLLPSELEEFCTRTEKEMSLQRVHAERKRYEAEYARLLGTNSPDMDSGSVVAAEMEAVRTAIQNIELSQVVMTCPCCSEKVIQSGRTLLKFEGVVQQGDTAVLKQRLQALFKLSVMKYPAPIDCRVIEDIPKEEARVKLARRCLDAQSKLVQIPAEVERLSKNVQEANRELLTIKRSLEVAVKRTKLLVELEAAIKPQEAPSNVKVVSKEVALANIDKLKQLKFCPQPVIDSATIRSQLKLQEAEIKLSKCEKPSKFVSEREVADYSSKLASLEVARELLHEDSLSLEQITVTSELFSTVSRSVRALEAKLTADKKHSAMDKQAREIEELCDQLDAKQREYDDACEYREIFERSFDTCAQDPIEGLRDDVNSFLASCFSEVRIDIPIESDKTKIVAYRGDKKIGAVTELSDGEKMLVSFAFRVIFCLMAKNSLIILDEVTEKLDVGVKDRCIKLMLNMAKKAGKTVLLTDHLTHCGDYDKILELKAKEE